MRTVRALLTAVVATAVVPLSAGQAVAAPPGNDTFGGATAVSLGFSEELNTTEATTDADDVEANADCGAPATDASVWYAFTASVDSGVVVDVSQSDYSAGVIVVTGAPGSFVLETCGPGTVGFFATAGTTYHVLAFDDQLDGVGTGGLLRISFNAAPPPPTVDFTVDPIGRVDQRSGVATLTGTFTCANADFLDVFGELRQPVGRFTIIGEFAFFVDGSSCDGTSQPWTAEVIPFNGKFKGGTSATMTFTFACGPFECSEGFFEHTVHLRGGK